MIPPKIHHVWPGRDPFRSELHGFRSSFVHHHPDWTFYFWRTDLGDAVSDEVRALVADPRYTVVVKSDVARFEMLRVHGGVYVDTDVECLRPFDPLLGNDFFCGRESEAMLCPSVVGSAPFHPLTELLVRAALDRIREVGPERANATPNEVSGPFLLTELVGQRRDVRIYEPSFFYPVGWWETGRLAEQTPDAYAKHWWRGRTSQDGWTKKQNFGEVSPAHPDQGNPVKYDLGGTGRRPGYVTVNLAGAPDRRCDILDLDALHPTDGDVDEFFLEHTLEHLPITRYVGFLRHLHRKLKVGGSVVVVQTDADVVIRDYVASRLTFRSMRTTLFTPEDRVHGNVLQTHQNMWSAAELARDFRAIGFETRTFDAGGWAFDMHDPLHEDDVRRDHGKVIRNLGVRATKV